MLEPSVYTHSSGMNFGIQGIGVGVVTVPVVLKWPGGASVGSDGALSKLGRGRENVYVVVFGICGVSPSWMC